MSKDEIYKAIQSAMSGNGTLPVNAQIRKYKDILVKKYKYDAQRFLDMSSDFYVKIYKNYTKRDGTNGYTNAIEKYDPEQGDFQTYVNGVVAYYLLNYIKELQTYYRKKEDNVYGKKVPIVVSQYDLDLEDTLLEETLADTGVGSDPEAKIFAKQLAQLLDEIFGNEKVYLLYLQKKLTQEEAAKLVWNEQTQKYGTSQQLFSKKFNEKKAKLFKALEEMGYDV